MFVSIVMPALNEENFIEQALDSILPEFSELQYEVLVMDGGSSDRTKEIVLAKAAANNRIKLFENPKKIQSAAVNGAVKLMDPRSTVFVRADCHAIYPAGFIETCVARLVEKHAASVVVPMYTVGGTCFQRAVAAVCNSRLGNGGAAHRNKGVSRYVEHGHHAAFDRNFFQSVGGYDESFKHNEDAELDFRIARSGGRIWLETATAITYFPRKSVRSLAQQYFSYGKGRARTVRKHRARLRIRQLLPLVVTGGSAVCLVLGIGNPRFLLWPAGYASLLAAWSIWNAWRGNDRCLLAMGLAALTIHVAWSLGFALQYLRGGILRPR